MAELSIDCPLCGKQNTLPVDHGDETFVCSSCGKASRLDSAAISGTEKAPDYLVGEVVSDCKIIEKVGEGGFGSVYKASDQNLQRIVAFKVMLQSLTTNAEFVQKFIREAVTAAQLNHPNIVAIHKVGRDERRGLHYLIMEFVEGRTLADVVKEKGVLKVEEALPIMIQACEALAAAHERNIVHRDIKPENLMLDKAGILKITDFGLAKSISTDQKSTKVMGTPHYMSPEQFEGKAVDGRSDIYSLGVTFFFLLSKSRPYEGQNTVQIIYAILTQQPKALPDLNKDVPPELWTVIQKMIAKKTEDRYQSLRETIVDLKRYQERTQSDKAQCGACGAKNPKGRKFCRGCGAALVVKCPSCAAESPSGATVCSACGADMARLLKIKKAMDSAGRFKALGDIRRAAESYRQVVELDPSHGEATSELSRLSGTLSEVDRVKTEAVDLAKTGDVESALSRVEDLLRRFPMASEVREHRDELKGALARRRVDRLLGEADQAAEKGGVREALDLLEQALRADPGRDDVRARRDDLSKRLAHVAESRQKAAKALAAGQYEEAFATASEVLKVMPGDTAMEEVRKKAQASVESVDQFVRRGREHVAGKRLQEALAEYEAAVSLRPGDKELQELVESTRGKISEHRDRVAQCRRLLAERDFEAAAKGLAVVLAEMPDDSEARSLLAACEKGRDVAQRARTIEDAMREATRLAEAGDLAASMTRLDQVLALAPDHPDAAARREELEQRLRGERDIRELVDEHGQEGRFGDAIAALERLAAANPGRAAELKAEADACRKKEAEAKANLEKAEAALEKKLFREALAAANAVLAVAPRFGPAAAVRKEAEKAVAGIDKFLADCDRLTRCEMFDDALEALDRARERGATPAECARRRASCTSGVVAGIKTDAGRALAAKDFALAATLYGEALERAKDDPDALRGRRAAERCLEARRSEPIAFRLTAAAAVLVLLGVVRAVAVAATSETGAKSAEAEARETKFERAFEEAADKADLREKMRALDGVRPLLDEFTAGRIARRKRIEDARAEALAKLLVQVRATPDVDAALKLAGDAETLAPESKEAGRLADFLDELRLGAAQAERGAFEKAAESFFAARAEPADARDAKRVAQVDERLVDLHKRWAASGATDVEARLEKIARNAGWRREDLPLLFPGR